MGWCGSANVTSYSKVRGGHYRVARDAKHLCSQRQLPDVSWWRGAGAEGRFVDADNSTRPRQETAGEGIPARAQWRRRAAGGALAIDMASLRSVGRCERFGALQRRMPLAPHASRTPLAHHTCCVFIERHSRRSPGMQGC